MTTPAVTRAAARPRSAGIRAASAIAGALFVAVAAQFAVPLPGTPVPMTLQPLAVIIVGGLLGPGLGAASLALYLALGAAGLPVFTPGGLPGLARLLGPTGGYLLGYPLAAWLVGYVSGNGQRATGNGSPTARPVARSPFPVAALAAILGLVVIHAGGLAQLYILTGSAGQAFAAGTVPFLAGDLVKAAVAALVIGRLGPATRALL